MESFLQIINQINSNQAIVYTLIRTIITYLYAVLLVRLGNRRFKLDTPMDLIFIMIIGAVLGRTVYGGASLASTLVSSLVLMALHQFFSYLSFKSNYLGWILKGKPKALIVNGKINWKNMEATFITKEDLLAECHYLLKMEDLSKVKYAFLERNGKISFINQ